ncbi:unnamed protein product [Gadus morhua 'NCC']
MADTGPESLSAPHAQQTVRRAHGLRSACHPKLFSQPPTAISLQCTAYRIAFVCWGLVAPDRAGLRMRLSSAPSRPAALAHTWAD